MQEPNPYKAPQVEEVAAERSDYYVEMPYLVVKNGTRLPLRCVITNVGVSEYRSTTLQYPCKWYQVAIGTRRCTILWAVEEAVHRKQKRMSYSRGLAVVGLASFLLASQGWGLFGVASLAISVPFTILCFGLSVYFRLRSLPMPYVKKYRRGYFWLAGLGPEFLASVQEELRSN